MGFARFEQAGKIDEQLYGNTICFILGALTGPAHVHDYGFGTSNCHNHALFHETFYHQMKVHNGIRLICSARLNQ